MTGGELTTGGGVMSGGWIGGVTGVDISGFGVVRLPLGARVCAGDAGGIEREIFVSSSSRTVSWIIAPQVRQIDKVGARSRLQTGHIIGRIGLAWIEKVSARAKTRSEYQRLL